MGFPAVVKPEFGASAVAVGYIRVDDVETLPTVYSMVRDVVAADDLSLVHGAQHLLASPRTGRLTSLPLPSQPPKGCLSFAVDGAVPVGTEVTGPEDLFVSVVADITLMAKDLRDARAIATTIIEHPPVVEPV